MKAMLRKFLVMLNGGDWDTYSDPAQQSNLDRMDGRAKP